MASVGARRGGVGKVLRWRAGKVWWVYAISSSGWVTAARVRPVIRGGVQISRSDEEGTRVNPLEEDNGRVTKITW